MLSTATRTERSDRSVRSGVRIVQTVRLVLESFGTFGNMRQMRGISTSAFARRPLHRARETSPAGRERAALLPLYQTPASSVRKPRRA